MLVFIDESGDAGLKFDQGSSPFFIVSLVVFEDDEEAEACDQRIDLLRRELKWQANEFHFYNSSDRIKRAFLEAVAPYNFFYYCVVFDKNRAKRSPQTFQSVRSFYQYTCGLVLETAKEKLFNATVIIDQTGNLDFKRQLFKYLREKMNNKHKKLVREVKMQRSSSNNLLQVADFVAGVTNRCIQDKKKFAEDYHKIISHREINVHIWPK